MWPEKVSCGALDRTNAEKIPLLCFWWTTVCCSVCDRDITPPCFIVIKIPKLYDYITLSDQETLCQKEPHKGPFYSVRYLVYDSCKHGRKSRHVFISQHKTGGGSWWLLLGFASCLNNHIVCIFIHPLAPLLLLSFCPVLSLLQIHRSIPVNTKLAHLVPAVKVSPAQRMNPADFNERAPSR